jgi:hypothetical protein
MRARRVDANHSQIVKAFRAMGCSVADLSSLGDGIPDLAIGLYGRTVLVEVKDGNKPPSKRRLTPDEQRFRDAWKGAYDIAESLEDVERIVRALSTLEPP